MGTDSQGRQMDRSGAKTFYEGVPIFRQSKDGTYFVMDMGNHKTELLRARGDNLEAIKSAAADGVSIGVVVAREGYVKEEKTVGGDLLKFCPTGFVIGLENKFKNMPGDTSLVGRPIRPRTDDQNHVTIVCNCGAPQEYEGHDGILHQGHSSVFFNIQCDQLTDGQLEQFKSALENKSCFIAVTGVANFRDVELKTPDAAPNYSLRQISHMACISRDKDKSTFDEAAFPQSTTLKP